MSKKFSKVDVNDLEIFMAGWVVPKDLADSNIFIEELMGISSFNQVYVKINHCLLTDFPEEDMDISEDDLDILVEDFDMFLDDGYIYLEESITFEMSGLLEEEIIENKIE